MLLLMLVPAAGAAPSTPEIGTTVVVKNEVVVEFEQEKRKLRKGNKVHQNEIVETTNSATAEIRLLDETKLAVGPSARITLDKFVYDANATPGSIVVNLSKGAFRFITGSSPSAAYEIRTPTTSLGVRGTVFDVYVAGNGETAILLHEGALDVCPTPGSCRRHDSVGRFVHVNLQRLISAPQLWDGSFMKGLSVAVAFPFVGRTLAIDPVRRLRHSDLAVGALTGKTPRVIEKSIQGGRNLPDAIGRTLPRPRLPF
jgi:hypothetical protein